MKEWKCDSTISYHVPVSFPENSSQQLTSIFIKNATNEKTKNIKKKIIKPLPTPTSIEVVWFGDVYSIFETRTRMSWINSIIWIAVIQLLIKTLYDEECHAYSAFKVITPLFAILAESRSPPRGHQFKMAVYALFILLYWKLWPKATSSCAQRMYYISLINV